MSSHQDLTQLLSRAAQGDAMATNELFPKVYAELRQLAEVALRDERTGHTLQPTALVHEAYLRLIGPASSHSKGAASGEATPGDETAGDATANWENRAHFFGAAARALRRVLTDHARARNATKRTPPSSTSPSSHNPPGTPSRPSAREAHQGVEHAPAPTILLPGEGNVDLEAMDAALEKLAQLDPQKVQIVELRYFAGLTGEETARALGVSPSTIAREWAFIRVWLHRELSAHISPGL